MNRYAIGLAIVLAACSTARDPEPEGILTLRYPVISASRTSESGPLMMVRIDQDGRAQQAFRPTSGEPWRLYSSSIRADRVAPLVQNVIEVPSVQFRELQHAPDYFELVAETSDGRLELRYNDESLPCADEVFQRFKAVWKTLNDTLPQPLPDNALPRCTP